MKTNAGNQKIKTLEEVMFNPGNHIKYFTDDKLNKSWTGKKRSNLLPTCLGTSITALCDLKTKDSLLLCGDLVFPEVVFTQVNNCSDSAFFAVSNGTERYSDYVDSLNNVFDSLYRAKCLQAYNYEVFTVTHTVSEYHYTLYFYDQAGNLVKTVPPQDVVPKRTANWFTSVRNARASHQTKTPSHLIETDYRYNTLNQVVQQSTPDAGISNYFYDRLGRLVLSKNAKQNASNNYSYTKYNYLGRISEVGELQSTETMNASVSNSPTLLNAWMNNAAASRTDITFTAYDAAYPVALTGYLVPRNLRNRVTWMALYATAQQADNVVEQTTASFFSYDIHGNVDTLLQDFRVGAMADAQNRFKKIVYDYDLISGKVNMVSYQPGRSDAFYHKYQYDAENRLTDVFTSSDRIYWEHDAFYQYYRHGPLSRVVIGQQQVQGIDYAYTLQGWLKGVNSTALTPDLDMGSDGKSNGIVARDAFGFALHYFGSDTDQSIPANDYKPVSNTVNPFAKGYATADFKPLFNGNIAAVSMNLKMGTNAITGSPLLYDYTYDQLNRLAAMRAFSGLDTLNNLWTPVATQDYAEDVTYDANGNILTYNRNGAAAASGTAMDALKYKYYYINTSGVKIAYDPLAALPGDVKTLTNQLAYVTDDINSTYTEDIDNQLVGNYDYDGIGNLIKDVKEGITSITWNVYGKIKTINKNGGVVISYTYDASGNRISKNVNGKETWYVRDASGNVLSVYTKNAAVNGGTLTQTEIDLYGSSRLGILNRNNYVSLGSIVPSVGSHYYTSFTRGKKYYELTNHLGNVLTVVSDRKKPFAKTANQNVVDFYGADIKSVSDYYPFGMVMPGRKFTASSYRYGFNGKEKDANITSEDYDYGMRIYDARLGRFLSVDPLSKSYPELTPYQFASNRPIDGIDLDGLEYKKSSYYSVIIQSSTYLNMVTGNSIDYQYLKVVYNANNIPDYFKKNNLKPESAEIAGWDKSCYTGSGCLENRIRPDFSRTSSLSPHDGMDDGSMNNAGIEPTMQLSEEVKKGAGGTPAPVTTSLNTKVLAAAEIVKSIGIGWEIFSQKNKAFSEVTNDKLTFYFAINVVDHYLDEARTYYKKQGKILDANIDNLKFKSYLINFVNSGSIPFTSNQIDGMKLQGKNKEAANMEFTNKEVKRIGTLIYNFRSTDTQLPKEKGAISYGSGIKTE